jgi:hypothetical protein
MAHPLDIPEGVRKQDGRWLRDCPVCFKAVDHLRRNYCIGAYVMQQPCKQCSNKSNNPSGMVGSVRVSWFNSFQKSALSRGYCWELTPEFVDCLYQVQNGCCAFSGVPIKWDVSGWRHTASIDRRDNSKGYTEDNVRLVHKDINMMRGSLPEEVFIEWCRLVTDKVKW